MQTKEKYPELENQAGNMDTISNMLTTIRNAYAVKHETAKISHSKVNLAILEILKREGWIKGVEVKKREEKKWIIVTFAYSKDGVSAIRGLKRVSKPGKRIYIKTGDIRKVRSGYGLVVLSTPLGIITGDEARKKRVGGEVLCEVW